MRTYILMYLNYMYTQTPTHQTEQGEAPTTNSAAQQTPQPPPGTWWEGPLKDRFLPGQSSDTLYKNFSEAQGACLELALRGQVLLKGLIYVCMYVCMYVYMYVCMYVCIYICMYIYKRHATRA